MKATIQIFAKKYTAEGKTPIEAIGNLKVVGFAKAKSLLTVGERTIVLNPHQTQRLFAPNALMREIALKTTANRF
jgi:hypothetical protein